MDCIYFDNGSTSFPKAPGVSDSMKNLLDRGAFNINRGGYEGAYELAGLVFEARQLISDFFGGGNLKNVVFTPGVTYSLNYIIKGWLRPGDHVIVSSMEHNAVMRPLTQSASRGVEFSVAQADGRGVLDPAEVERLIKPSTKGIIMTAASNVCGTFLPVREIGEICRKHNLRFVLDSAQMAGPFDIDMDALGIDTLTFTGHKGLLGPQGIGGMIISDGMARDTEALISGGTGSLSDSELVPDFLPDRFEAGTMNLPGIIGLYTAIKWHMAQPKGEVRRKEMEITRYFLEKTRDLPGVRQVGLPGVDGRAAIVSLDFQGRDNAEVSFELDSQYGIMTRCGMHCAPRAHKTLGTYPQGTVRFSFSHSSTHEEVDRCAEAILRILAK